MNEQDQKDIKMVFDMVIGDYMSVLSEASGDEFSPESFDSFRRGIMRLGELAEIDPSEFDVCGFGLKEG